MSSIDKPITTEMFTNFDWQVKVCLLFFCFSAFLFRYQNLYKVICKFSKLSA